MKLKFLVVLLVIFILLSSIITYFYVAYRVVDKKEIKMYLTVADHLGVNTATDAIYFGTIFNGSSSTRTISIKNERCKKCLVKIIPEAILKFL